MDTAGKVWEDPPLPFFISSGMQQLVKGVFESSTHVMQFILKRMVPHCHPQAKSIMQAWISCPT